MADTYRGKVVAFYDEGELQTGIISTSDAGYIQILKQDSSTIQIPINRIQLVSDEQIFQSGEALGALRDFVLKVDEAVTHYDPSTLDAALDKGSMGIEELLQGSDIDKFSTLYYLRQNPQKYMRKKNFVRLMSSQETELFQHEAKQRELQRNNLSRAEAYIKALISEQAPPADLELERWILTSLRLYLSTGSSNDLTKLLGILYPHQPLMDSIRDIRLALGEITTHTDPFLFRSGLPVCFEKELDMTLADSPEVQETYRAFCIDDEDSRDLDDAISFDLVPGGYRLGIHISLVAARIALDTPLYEEAKRRISSLYLAPQDCPMLPEALSQGELSLTSGNSRECLSLILDLDSSYEIKSQRISQSSVVLCHNYSYREVDRKIAEEPFANLHNLALTLSRKRGKDDRNSDGTSVYSYFKIIDGKLRMFRINPDSPSRRIIEELMILYNSSMASAASQAGIPLIYRSMNQIYDEENDRMTGSVYLSTTATYHPGTGASAYVHVSSPIRRFTDLINQYQLISLVRDETAPFAAEDLNEMIPLIEETLLRQRQVVQASQRYWLMIYILQNDMMNPLPATVIKKSKTGLLLELHDYNARIKLDTDAWAPPGSQVQVLIHTVQPDKMYATGDLI